MSVVLSFADLWQQDSLSDVTLTVQAPADPVDGGNHEFKVLQSFPAHRVLLSTSPYFKAQIQRWQQPGGSAAADSSSADAVTVTPAVTLTLSSEQEEPAAMAVLEGLYGARTMHDILGHMSVDQLVQAVALADMLQIPAVSKAIMDWLVTTCEDSPPALAASFADLLARDAQVPKDLRGLLPAVFKKYSAEPAAYNTDAVRQLLLEEFGDIEVVMEHPPRACELYKLPLPALVLLLSADDLQVSSEDNVLAIASQFTHQLQLAHPDDASYHSSMSVLAGVVRCPDLSRPWLLTTMLNTDDDWLFQGAAQHLPNLIGLVSLLLTTPLASKDRASLEAAELQRLLPGCPASWLRGPRRGIRPLDAVTVQWHLPMQLLITHCRDTFAHAQGAGVFPEAPLCSDVPTPYLGGAQYLLEAELRPHGDGAVLGLFVGFFGHRPSGFSQFTYEISCCSITRKACSGLVINTDDCGWEDFFSLGPLAEGWDEAAWVAAGLPLSGQLVIELKVSDVNPE